MSEFIPPVTEGIADVPQSTELPGGENLVRDTMLEISQTAQLEEGEAEWMKSLLERMVSPLMDIFRPEAEGYQTELISPGETGERVEAGLDAHRITEATEEWHVQEGDNSCAVCTQQFIINEFLDMDVTEEELCVIAESNGWDDPATGTAPSDVGNLLEHFGIDTQTNYEGDISDIKNTLDQGGRVIVAVDSMALWTEGFGTYPLYGADHAVEVIGIDDSDPLNVKVILNDSGVENGCGREVPYLEFMEAWAPSGGFMVSAFPDGQ